MFVLVELFDGLIERGTQAVGHISSALGEPNSWVVALCMDGIDCHTLCIVGVVLGNGLGCTLLFVLLLRLDLDRHSNCRITHNMAYY